MLRINDSESSIFPIVYSFWTPDVVVLCLSLSLVYRPLEGLEDEEAEGKGDKKQQSNKAFLSNKGS